MYRCLFSVVLIGGLASPAQGQQPDWDPRRVYATRGALDTLLTRFEQSAASPAYSAVLRDRAREQAAEIRQRLEKGDFQAGDRIDLGVEREAALTDTFTVAAGPLVALPVVGTVTLSGVLRSELERHLRQELGRYIRDPVVRARTLIQISVIGEVGSPGFYSLPTEVPLTDALARAGQVTRDADLGKISVERGTRTVWSAEALSEEIIEGRTLDQLGLRAGDRVVVGKRSRTSLAELQSPLQALTYLLAIPFTIAGAIAIF